MLSARYVAWTAVCLLLPSGLNAAELTPRTVEAFGQYVRQAESRIEDRVRKRDYLWADDASDRLKTVRAGEVAVAPLTGKGDSALGDGLVHDWIGAVFVPGATLRQALTVMQNYDRNKIDYRPEVIDSKLVSRNGNDFHVYLRLMKKKVITVVLNSEHDVRYLPVDATFCHSRSYSTRIAEVENPGKAGEREAAAGDDHGFLWKLNSYWRFYERDGGVYVECEAISLTRDVPVGLGWMVEPIIRQLPRESLVHTLRSAREAIQRSPAASQ